MLRCRALMAKTIFKSCITSIFGLGSAFQFFSDKGDTPGPLSPLWRPEILAGFPAHPFISAIATWEFLRLGRNPAERLNVRRSHPQKNKKKIGIMPK